MVLQEKRSSTELEAAISDGGAAAGGGGALSKCLLDYNPIENEEYEEVVATWLASLLVLADHLALTLPPAQQMLRPSRTSYPCHLPRPQSRILRRESQDLCLT